MNKHVNAIFNRLLKETPALECCMADILKAYEILVECYQHDGKVLLCGNGGSAADAEHITGELMKGFLQKRRICEKDAKKLMKMYPEDGRYLSDNLQQALPAISLVSQTSLITAFGNDVASDMVFAQQVYGYGRKGDVLVGLSTSGNSLNVVKALQTASAIDMITIGFTGENGGAMKHLCNAIVRVPASETYRVQEYHMPAYHALCAMVEAEFFSSSVYS